jgi:hypothetical protein
MDTEIMCAIIRSILDVAVKQVAEGVDSELLAEEILHSVLAATGQVDP